MSENQRIDAREVLVLDSSTFIKEVRLTVSTASALKHYLCHRCTQLVVPKAVAEECERHLTRIAGDRVSGIEKNLVWLGHFFGRVNGWTAPSENTIKERTKMLARADHLGAIVLPETVASRDRAESRNHLQRPPAHQGSGLNDCRIWEQCLELLSQHDVVLVAQDKDFRGHGDASGLHPQLRAEAESVGAGQRLTFHSELDPLLSELKREIPSVAKERVHAFVYSGAAADIEELKANSGYEPVRLGDVALTFLTTDQADIVEVRIAMDETWRHPGNGKIADFRVGAWCHYGLTDHRLQNLNIGNLRLMLTQPDGSTRAVRGSYVNVNAGTIYAGAAPMQPDPEILG